MMQQISSILIVDNEIQICCLVKEAFEASGCFRAFTALNGVEALEVIKDRDIHFLLVDMKMPVMEGPELIANLRDSTLRVPTAIMTGYESSLKEASSLVEKVFFKPFDVNEIVNFVSMSIEREIFY